MRYLIITASWWYWWYTLPFTLRTEILVHHDMIALHNSCRFLKSTELIVMLMKPVLVCDMAHHDAGISHYKISKLWPWRDVHGQQRYSNQRWHLSDDLSILMCLKFPQEDISHTITPYPSWWWRCHHMRAPAETEIHQTRLHFLPQHCCWIKACLAPTIMPRLKSLRSYIVFPFW